MLGVNGSQPHRLQKGFENIAGAHPINDCGFLEGHPPQGMPELYIGSDELSRRQNNQQRDICACSSKQRELVDPQGFPAMWEYQICNPHSAPHGLSLSISFPFPLPIFFAFSAKAESEAHPSWEKNHFFLLPVCFALSLHLPVFHTCGTALFATLHSHRICNNTNFWWETEDKAQGSNRRRQKQRQHQKMGR